MPNNRPPNDPDNHPTISMKAPNDTMTPPGLPDSHPPSQLQKYESVV